MSINILKKSSKTALVLHHKRHKIRVVYIQKKDKSIQVNCKNSEKTREKTGLVLSVGAGYTNIKMGNIASGNKKRR